MLDSVARSFSEAGALGVLLLDASCLSEVERAYGHEALQSSMAALGALVRDTSQEVLGGDDIVAAGEIGRSEVLVFLARPAGDSSFFERELPALALWIGDRLERQGHRVAYPYLRRIPQLTSGIAMALWNPKLSAASQIRAAVEEARADAALERRILERGERRSLQKLIITGNVRSVYEPIVDAKTLTVFGYEALARGPEGTELAAPLALFALADRENLLFELDCLCRRAALEGAVDFPAGTKLFLNIRPTAIHDPGFQADALTRTLDECGLSPSDVVFEISEQESIENFDVFREARDFYGNLGFQFALDDTGTGYASLQSLVELSPEFIKIDRSLVHGIDQDEPRQALLHAFQTVADRVSARIIGEGLDTLEELDMLKELGIPFGQGWLFGKPTPLRGSE